MQFAAVLNEKKRRIRELEAQLAQTRHEGDALLDKDTNAARQVECSLFWAPYLQNLKRLLRLFHQSLRAVHNFGITYDLVNRGCNLFEAGRNCILLMRSRSMKYACG